MSAAWTGTASADVFGLERVTAATSYTSQASKTKTVSCPAGKKVLSTGGQVVGAGPGEVVMDDILPDSQLTAVTASAKTLGTGTGTSWRLRVYAVCALPPDGLKRSEAASAFNSDRSKQATAACPDNTDRVVGAGVQVAGGDGRVTPNEIMVDADLRRVTVRAEEAISTANAWSVRAYAVCAQPVPGLKAVTAESDAPGPSNIKRATATCPSGTRVVGSAGSVPGAFSASIDDVGLLRGQVMDDFRPTSTLTQVTVRATGGTANDSPARAVAICATQSVAPQPLAPTDDELAP
jgi:hypothetical protein